LNRKSAGPLSNVAFNLNLRHYSPALAYVLLTVWLMQARSWWGAARAASPRVHPAGSQQLTLRLLSALAFSS